MKKEQLIEAIAKKKGKTPESVSYDLSTAYNEIFAAIVEAVASGKVVEIPQFGKFYCTERHLGRARMPSTKKIPDFSPDFAFRDAISKAAKNDH